MTMEYLFRKYFWLTFLIVVLTAPCLAEKAVLVVQINDVQNHPVIGVLIKTAGASEPARSDPTGLARIKLDSTTKVNAWIHLQIVESPKGKDLVLISPWDGAAQVPPFEDESTNYVPVVTVNRGDRRILEDPTAIRALAARINRENSSKPKTQDPAEQRREALGTIAQAFGLPPEEVDKAIRAWGEKTNDPYEKGLAALYEKNYPLASQELSKSLEKRENELVKAQAATADAAFFLGQSTYRRGEVQRIGDCV
jgi:hypothetical protein